MTDPNVNGAPPGTKMPDEPHRDPGAGDAAPSKRGLSKAQIGILMIIALFVVPMVTSWLLFFSGWKPEGTVNYGELVHPARPLELPILDDRDGKGIAEDWMYGKWTLLYLTEASCDESCRKDVITLAKIRLGQNRNVNRVRVALMMADQAGFPSLKEWLQPDADLLTMAPVMADREAALRNFNIEGLEGPVFGRTYLIDPLGNLMMRYPAGFDPTRLRKDLEKLLKLSQVG